MSTAFSDRSTGRLAALVAGVLAALEKIPAAIPAFVLRLGVALVFWRSAGTKLINWELTVSLFRDEYKVPVLSPELAAYLATAVELATPIMLLVGIATRLGAAAMLGMTLVIQIFVYPTSYPDHLLWAGPLLYLILRGPGGISIDHFLRRRFIGG